MGDLSKHFSRSEFSCRCGCGFDTVDVVLVTWILEAVHEWAKLKLKAKVKIVITSGNRCPSHNASVGGAPNSQHIYGKAADFKVYYLDHGVWVQVPPGDVADFLESTYPDKFGVGRYHNRTHADSRDAMARWG